MLYSNAECMFPSKREGNTVGEITESLGKKLGAYINKEQW
jgi:hypothetical protein